MYTCPDCHKPIVDDVLDHALVPHGTPNVEFPHGEFHGDVNS